MNIAVLASDAEESALLRDLLDTNTWRPQFFTGLPELQASLNPNGCDLLLASLPAFRGASENGVAALRPLLPTGTPILLLADENDEEELVAAMASGADEYLLKPLRRVELITRMRVLLKRARPDHPSLLPEMVEGVTFDASRLRVKLHAVPVDLTRKEFQLALLLFRHLGRPLSRAFILERLWPGEPDHASRTLDTHISRVRNKLGLRPGNGYRLSPVYSYGYQLERVDRS